MLDPTWFLTSGTTGSDSGVRVFCFPHAGGNPRVFLDWQTAVGDAAEIVAVCPPGRGHRYREPMVTGVAELATRAAEAIRTAADRPFVLFGHSLGAVAAFETARLLRGRIQPRHLVASGCSAPCLLPTDRVIEAARLEGRAFTEAVGFFGGLPPEVVADDDIAALLLPSLRADFRMVAGYQYQPDAPLGIPLTLINGRDDPHVKEDGLEPWQRECATTPTVHWVDGGHFYFFDDPTAVIDVIRSVVGEDRAAHRRDAEHIEVI